MEHMQKSIARKWERHYKENRTTLAMALMLLGLCFIISLVILWPQRFTSDVFNSRLLYHNIIDIEDYFTCSPDYQRFVVDEPPVDDRLISIWVFNITNPRDTIVAGYKPRIKEVGPYGYLKHTYKYDISFDASESLNVTFKEYTLLKEVNDVYACQRAFFKNDRGFSNSLLDPCIGDHCLCKDHNSILTTINPLFLKIFWSESPHKLVAHYSRIVMKNVLDIYEDDFPEAVRYHLVPKALEDVFTFRTQMQAFKFLKAIYNHAFKLYSINDVSDMLISASFPTILNCGLSEFGINSCPYSVASDIRLAYTEYTSNIGVNKSDFTMPTNMVQLLNASSPISFLNEDIGFPRFLGICVYIQLLYVNGFNGYTMINKLEHYNEMQYLIVEFSKSAYGADYSRARNPLIGAEIFIRGIANYIVRSFIDAFPKPLQLSVQKEWAETNEPVVCSPLGKKCLWQWGYMRKLGNNMTMTGPLIYAIMDVGSKINTNPSNIYYSGNTAPYFNSLTFCKRYKRSRIAKTADEECSETDIRYTYEDALIRQPTGLWAAATGTSTVNTTNSQLLYRKASEEDQEAFFNMSCDVATLLNVVYRTATDYHDEFVIRYLNNPDRRKLQGVGDFSHNFTIGLWKELGYAQWGAGIVTLLLEGVRSVYQIKRQGMWIFGRDDYFEALTDYSTWANRAGYPRACINNVNDSKTLMYALAGDDPDSLEFRRHLVYAATTFIGDGVNIISGVGQIGDVSYVEEAFNADFTCSGTHHAACDILNTGIYSGHDQCLEVEDYFIKCIYLVYGGSLWANNCNLFQTSMSASLKGIPCDLKFVNGHEHPFRKLRVGFWCPNAAACSYSWGGLYATMPVRRLLFEGFSEPSLNYYLNLKHASDDVHVLCRENQYDRCGHEILRCNNAGITMQLPNGKTKNLTYGETPNDEFFAPELVMLPSGELIWPHSQNPDVAAYAETILSDKSQNVVRIFNPHWAAFPAWNSDDADFNKFIQCQKRLFGGPPNLFKECYDTLNTGRKNFNETLHILKVHGNTTIRHFSDSDTKVELVVNGTSTDQNMFGTSLWDGFLKYDYPYVFKTAGPEYYKSDGFSIVDKNIGYRFELSQKDMYYVFEKDIVTTLPFAEGNKGTSYPNKSALHQNRISNRRIGTQLRRFSETKDTWDQLRRLGQARDFYGMPYTIPYGMASLDSFTSLPMLVSTPHMWGNQMWGGLENRHVDGYTPDMYAQFTFIDYDPVTGKSIRSAVRQQFLLRAERNPLMPNLISSQRRCVAPTRLFSGAMGYGCYSYIPLFWYEDAKFMSIDEYYRLNDHFYTRPARGLHLSLFGLSFGLVFFAAGLVLYISEAYFRRKFNARVYVD